jgi:hypothetical protein
MGLVMLMLVLFGLGAWKLMARDDEPAAADRTAIVSPADEVAPSDPPSDPPPVFPTPEIPPEDESTPVEAVALEGEDEGGSSGGELVDDPPPADDEVIEILEDETDPSVLEDDGTEAPAVEDPNSSEGSGSKPRTHKRAPSTEEAPPPPGAAATSGYITPLAQGPRTDQSGARRYCEGLAKSKHLGVRGWKLVWPSLAKKFSKVRQVKMGRYWTSARWRGRARVIEVPAGRTASKRISRKFRPLCVARWPQ